MTRACLMKKVNSKFLGSKGKSRKSVRSHCSGGNFRIIRTFSTLKMKTISKTPRNRYAESNLYLPQGKKLAIEYASLGKKNAR